MHTKERATGLYLSLDSMGRRGEGKWVKEMKCNREDSSLHSFLFLEGEKRGIFLSLAPAYCNGREGEEEKNL